MKTLVKTFVTAACALLVSSIGVRAESLSEILREMPSAQWNEVQAEAQRISNSGGLAKGSTQANEEKTYSGSYTPQHDMRLAVLSDDGCNVTINGSQVLSRKGTGQALPDLGSSLQKIRTILTAGSTYQITVEYSNTVYTGDSDIDGVTLFAYSALLNYGVEVEACNTPATGDDLVKLGTNTACRIRATSNPSDNPTVVLTNPDSRLRFIRGDGSVGSTATLTLPKDGSWVGFTISGHTVSANAGDAVIEAHNQYATGSLKTKRPVSVWNLVSPAISVMPAGVYELGYKCRRCTLPACFNRLSNSKY